VWFWHSNVYQSAPVTWIISKPGYKHTHPFNGPFSGTSQVSQYQKGETSLDFTEAGDSEWQWHQLGHMQVCTSLQTDNHASIQPVSFLQAGCPSCHPTNSVKALKEVKPGYKYISGKLVDIFIPAKAFASDYVITGVGLCVCLCVCLFVTTITK